jgi:hypothetical protein
MEQPSCPQLPPLSTALMSTKDTDEADAPAINDAKARNKANLRILIASLLNASKNKTKK